MIGGEMKDRTRGTLSDVATVLADVAFVGLFAAMAAWSWGLLPW